MIDPQNMDAVRKLIDALVGDGSPSRYAYTAGYLETYLSQILTQYVPKEKQSEVRIEILNTACTILLSNRK